MRIKKVTTRAATKNFSRRQPPICTGDCRRFGAPWRPTRPLLPHRRVGQSPRTRTWRRLSVSVGAAFVLALPESFFFWFLPYTRHLFVANLVVSWGSRKKMCTGTEAAAAWLSFFFILILLFFIRRRASIHTGEVSAEWARRCEALFFGRLCAVSMERKVVEAVGIKKKLNRPRVRPRPRSYARRWRRRRTSP